MKSGRSLQELALELKRQSETKKDYVAPTNHLSMRPIKAGVVILDGVNGGMPLRPIAHAQLANTLGIPKVYYDKLLAEQPDLLSLNVNRWLASEGQRVKVVGRDGADLWTGFMQPYPVRGTKKLIRTLDNEVRAILSDSYRPLDNIDLAEAVLPRLFDLNATVVSGQVTDSRFYIQAVTDRIRGEVKQGDVIQAGVVVSNSEVGQGSLRVEALDFRLICLNGMIRESSIRKAHLGRGARGQDAIEDAREWFRTETRIADDRAFFLKVQDATAAMFDVVRFNQRIEQYKEASNRMIPVGVDPVKVVETTAKKFGLSDGERSSVLQHLIRGGDMSTWGLSNAVTRTAQDVESYDRATSLEAIGGDVVELNKEGWKSLVAV